MHRSIRYQQSPNYQQLYKSDVGQSQLQYNGDLVLADEEENDTTLLDGIIKSLNYRLSNERTWETELYAPHIFPQTHPSQILSKNDPPVAVRLLQHTMKTVVRIPEMRLPYTSYPPIVSNVDKRLTDGIETAPPWLIPIKEGKVINDIVYAVNDRCLWDSMGGRLRKEVREQLAGYNLFPDSDYMLPYLLIEDKRQGNSPGYAVAYVTLIAASILHQRLKLRAFGNMHTMLSCPELIVHCMVMVGSNARYIRVGLRGPSKTHVVGTDELYFVRYRAEIRGVFDLTRCRPRNQFKSLLRMIHAFGIGSHHEMQRLEVENALETINSAADGLDNGVDMESIMNVDSAFHCVPVEGQEGEYALQHTDITMNGHRGDGLEPDLPPLMDYLDPSDADTRNLLLPMDDSESSKADTREKPAKPAAKNKAPAKKRKAPAKKRKAPVKEKKEPTKGRSTSSRKRGIEAEVDEEEQGETEEVTQEKERASKRTKPHVNYKE
jgi:hypothetical protein